MPFSSAGQRRLTRSSKEPGKPSRVSIALELGLGPGFALGNGVEDEVPAANTGTYSSGPALTTVSRLALRARVSKLIALKFGFGIWQAGFRDNYISYNPIAQDTILFSSTNERSTRATYISLPILVEFNWEPNDKLRWYLGIGPSLSALISYRYDTFNDQGAELEPVRQGPNSNGLVLGVHAAGGLALRVSPKLHLLFQPEINFGAAYDTDLNVRANYRPLQVAVAVGLDYRFGESD